MTLGEKIQDLRRKNAMSQDVLAEKLEVSRQAVSKWERDEAVPETDKIVRIAQVFGISTDFLLLREPEGEQPKPQDPPRAQPGRSAADRLERFIRRHGYKGGYLLMGYGVLCGLIGLLFRGIWRSAVSGMTETFGNAAGSMGSGLPGMWGAPGDGIFSGVLDAADSMGQMAMGWGNVFLILLIPGVILIALGIIVLIKGKKISDQVQQ